MLIKPPYCTPCNIGTWPSKTNRKTLHTNNSFRHFPWYIIAYFSEVTKQKKAIENNE